MSIKRSSRILGAALLLASVGAFVLIWRLDSGNVDRSEAATERAVPTERTAESSQPSGAAPLAEGRAEARPVQSIDKAVSFTGTALSSAARVEAWRVLAGESPEYVQLALGDSGVLSAAHPASCTSSPTSIASCLARVTG